jgi:hypothetical protein
MPVQLLRFTAIPGRADELSDAIEAAFAAIHEAKPEGIRYDYYRVAGSDDYVAVVELADGADNPLFAIPAAQELRAVVARHAAAGPPAPASAQVLGRYDALGG